LGAGLSIKQTFGQARLPQAGDDRAI